MSIRAGTTADTQIESGNLFGAASQTGGFVSDFKLTSATALLKAGQGATIVGSYSVASGTAAPAAVTITDASANALYASLTIASSSTNDTVGIQSAQIELITP